MTDGIRGKRKKKRSLSRKLPVSSYHTQRPVATYNTWLFRLLDAIACVRGICCWCCFTAAPLSINERKEIKIIVIIFSLFSSSLNEKKHNKGRGSAAGFSPFSLSRQNVSFRIYNERKAVIFFLRLLYLLLPDQSHTLMLQVLGFRGHSLLWPKWAQHQMTLNILTCNFCVRRKVTECENLK